MYPIVMKSIKVDTPQKPVKMPNNNFTLALPCVVVDEEMIFVSVDGKASGLSNALPQLLQKRTPSAFSKPHFGHFIVLNFFV